MSLVGSGLRGVKSSDACFRCRFHPVLQPQLMSEFEEQQRCCYFPPLGPLSLLALNAHSVTDLASNLPLSAGSCVKRAGSVLLLVMLQKLSLLHYIIAMSTLSSKAPTFIRPPTYFLGLGLHPCPCRMSGSATGWHRPSRLTKKRTT